MNLPASAGDMGTIPCPARSLMLRSVKAHAPQVLSLCSEPGSRNHGSLQALEPVFRGGGCRLGKPANHS